MSTTVHINGTVHLLSSLSWNWKLTIVTSCDSLNEKLENGLKKHVQNITRIKYGLAKLVVIFFLLIQDVIMWVLLQII